MLHCPASIFCENSSGEVNSPEAVVQLALTKFGPPSSSGLYSISNYPRLAHFARALHEHDAMSILRASRPSAASDLASISHKKSAGFGWRGCSKGLSTIFRFLLKQFSWIHQGSDYEPEPALLTLERRKTITTPPSRAPSCTRRKRPAATRSSLPRRRRRRARLGNLAISFFRRTDYTGERAETWI